MKAAIRSKYGSSKILTVKEIERPVPRENEILLKVHAATVNRTDCAILTGKPYIIRLFTGLIKPRNKITGTDFSGEIEEIGHKVTSYKIGDRIWGFQDLGLKSHAQYLTIAENKDLALVPDNISLKEVVTCIEGAHYAYNFINKVKIKPNDKVLVNGATGAIGSALVQLLRNLDAKVTAVCNTENIELIGSLGAEKIIDYKKEDFAKYNDRYHYIFDAVGKSSFGKCKSLLFSKGVYISSELGKKSENVFLSLITPLLGGKKVVFPFPSNIQESIDYIRDLISKGKFKPVIDKTYPLENIAEAYDYVASGKKTGNVVILLQ